MAQHKTAFTLGLATGLVLGRIVLVAMVDGERRAAGCPGTGLIVW